MLNSKYLVLLISLLSIIQAVKSDDQAKSKFQPCNAEKSTPDKTGCPKLANCIENRTINGALESYCVCAADYTVNQNYSATDNKSQYCIERKSETHSTETPTTQATKVLSTSSSTLKPVTPTSTLKPEVTTPTAKVAPTEPTTTTTTSTKKPEADKNDVKVAPVPEPHHILGGILLPIFIVLGFIGAVFAIRKFDLIERAHGYIRNRNQQTRYNGLMENDFDDDPLLI